MAVDLGETDIDPSLPKYRKMMEGLQANILKPHGRKEADHLFLRFTAGREDVRSWIRTFARDHVTSAWVQLEEARAYREHGTPGGLVAGLSLSAKGYQALGLDSEKFGESGRVFREGMKRRRFSLIARNRDPPSSEWETPYRGEVHALIALAHESLGILEAKTREVTKDVRSVADVLVVERGTVLRNARGDAIEQFGFVDARSQPLFLRADLDEERKQGTDAWDPSAPLGLVLVDDPFTEEEDSFGSYLVFRKLRQDVAGFRAGVRALASELSASEDLAGAYVVGRFQDGSPVTLQREDGLGPVNNFAYLPQDSDGNRCPFHAHIRKVNQRGANRALSDAEERSRRIVRRGIPYGVRSTWSEGNGGESTPSGEAGLLFMCFQSNIARQFEFIQRSWSDNPNFPEFLLIPGLNTGDDALIGQHPRAKQKWPETWGEGGRIFGRERFNFGGYIRLRGGEYLFTPSLPFLRNL